MPKWLKVILVLLAVVVLLCGLSSGGLYFWANKNGARLKRESEKAKRDGASFAWKSDAGGCVDEGLRRLGEHNGIIDQAENNLFLKACLGQAKRPDGFCTGVPAHGEIMAAASWALERCAAKGKPKDQDCARLMQVVQTACQPAPTPLPPG